MGKGWEKSGIVPIFKGSNEEETGNYRGVLLLDTGYKMPATTMDERIRN